MSDSPTPSGASDEPTQAQPAWTTPTSGWWSESDPSDYTAPPAVPTPQPRRAALSTNRGLIFAAIAIMTVSALLTVAVMSFFHWPDNRGALPASQFAPTSPASPSFPGGRFRQPSGAFSRTDPAAAAIAAKVDPSIVDINTQLDFGQGGEGAGTGMILDSSGDILTNNHVVDGATSISVTRVDNGKTYTATVLGTDPTEDIAVIHIKGATGLTPITVGNSSAVSPGDTIFAIGNAGGVGGTPSAVSGVVQAVNQTITASDPSGANPETLSGLIQVNAAIQAGDSGGALVNTSAQVIGMNTAASGGRRFQVGSGIGFAIPINSATNVARQILAGKASSKIHLGVPGFLGVGMTPNSTSTGPGVVVSTVQPGSPAASAGIKAGDTVTAIAGQSINSASALASAIKSHRSGDKIPVSWTDQSGHDHTATVTLVEGPAD